MTEPVETQEEQEQETPTSTDSKRYLVKLPWHLSSLIGNGKFPDLDNKGAVEMSADEKEEAKAAAKQLRIKILVKEV